MRNPIEAVVTGRYREHRNTQCVHCGHIGFSSAFPDEPVIHAGVCSHCTRAGRTMPDTEIHSQYSQNPEPDTPIRYRRIAQPGLAVVVEATGTDGVYWVRSRSNPSAWYVTSRSACDCRAGQFGRRCWHKALVEAIA